MNEEMMTMRKLIALATLLIAAGCATRPAEQTAAPVVATPEPVTRTEPVVVNIDSPSPLIVLKVMVRAGSTADPLGKGGLARLVADGLIQGGFGDPQNPVTKEALAEITQPWGDGAMPGAQVASRTATFHITVPGDILEQYLERVFIPMFTTPLFAGTELERIRTEMDAAISSYRHENLENLGLAAIDQYVNEGTRYEHQSFGTETSIPRLTRQDVVDFYRAYYRPGNIIVGVSSTNPQIVQPIVDAVNRINAGVTSAVPPIRIGNVRPIRGRQAVVIEEPNAPAAGIHLGFPIDVNRADPDFWPLYVAQTWLGTHRDSFGRLYQEIRQERGYNYGSYAYVEHWYGKPFSLFQVFNQPREQQYFSIWIRPVGHEHAYHIGKAATYELDRLIQRGLTDEEVAAARNKARVLYLNLAETVSRLVAARMDDAFHGMTPGFLEGYLNRIDRVTTQQVNQAIRKHLQVENVKYVFITDSAHAEELIGKIRANQTEYGKSLADYQLEQVELEDGTSVWQIPEEKLEMLRYDAMWANYPLNIDTVRRVPIGSIFRTERFIDEIKAQEQVPEAGSPEPESR
jgi:zinc protease